MAIFELPNGKTVEIPDGMDPEKARLAIVRNFPDLFKRNQGFIPSMKAAFDTTAGNIEGYGAELANRAGLPNVEAGLRSMQTKNKQEIAKEYDPTTKEDQDAAFKQGLFSGLGAVARRYVTEPLGGIVGGYGPAMAESQIPYVGPALSLGTLMAQEAGGNLERQRQQTGTTNMLTATAGGIVQGAIDRFGLGKFVTGALGSGMAYKEAAGLAQKVLTGEMTRDAAEQALGSTMRNVLMETGANAALGTGMMVGNEAVRRGVSGQPIASPQAMDEYIQSAKSAAALSPVFGALHGMNARDNAVSKFIDPASAAFDQRLSDDQQSAINENLMRAADQGQVGPDRRTATPDVAAMYPGPERRGLGSLAPEDYSYPPNAGPDRRMGDSSMYPGLDRRGAVRPLTQDDFANNYTPTLDGELAAARARYAAQQDQNARASLPQNADAIAAFSQPLQPDLEGNILPGADQAPPRPLRAPEQPPVVDQRQQPLPFEGVQPQLDFNAPAPRSSTYAPPELTTQPNPAATIQTPPETPAPSPLQLPKTPLLDAQLQARRKQAAGYLLSPQELALVKMPLSYENPAAIVEIPKAPNVVPDSQVAAATGPRLTANEDFRGVVSPQAKAWKTGALEGHDLNTQQGRQAVQAVLRSVLSGTRNEDRRNALQSAITNLDKQPPVQDMPPAPVENAQPATPDVPAGEPASPAPAPTETPNAEAPAAQPAPDVPVQADGSANIGPVDGGNAGPADTARVPAPDAGGNVPADGVPERDVPGAGEGNSTLTPTPEPAPAPQEEPAAALVAPETPVGELPAAAKDRMFGQNVPNEDLGTAVGNGSFADAADALRKSSNPIIAHLGKLASKLKGVKLETSKHLDNELSDKDKVVYNAKSLLELRSMLDDAVKLLRNKKTAGLTPDIANAKIPATAKLYGLRNDNLGAFLSSMGVKDVAGAQKLLDTVNAKIKEAGEANLRKTAAKTPSDILRTNGQYDPSTRTVTVHEDAAMDEHVVGHEMAHALLQTAIDHPTEAQKPAIKQLGDLYSHVKRALKGERNYGLENVHDFAAEGLSNYEFQQKLAQIKYGNKTAWGRFTDMVARLLGFKKEDSNALTELLSLTEHLGNLEGADALRAAAADRPALKLGTYADTASKEHEFGPIEGGIRAVKNAAGVVKNLPSRQEVGSRFAQVRDKVEQELFNSKIGVSRLLPQAWTRRNERGNLEATATALLNGADYSIPTAKESLGVGAVRKNAEGYWKVFPERDNMSALNDAISKLPTTEDKYRVFNGIVTNLSYYEREQRLKQQQADGTVDADKDFARPAGVTDATIAQALRDAQTPEVKRALDIVRGINRQNIDTLEQGGIISAKTAAMWRTNQYYVPLNRVMEDYEMGGYSGKAGGVQTSNLKKFHGSERDVSDVMENLIRQRMHVVNMAMRNNAGVKALHEMQEYGVGDVTAHPLRPQGSGRNVITVKENGVQKFYTVGDRMAYKTLEGIAQDMPSVFDAMEKFTHLLRNAIMLSPDMIFRNMVRDATEAWAYNYTDKTLGRFAGDVAGHFGKGAVASFRDAMKGQRSHMLSYDISKFGIGGVREFTSLERERRAIMNEYMRGVNKNNWAGVADSAIHAAARFWEDLAAESEIATRNRVYHDVLARTGSETEAAQAAMNTMNFRQRGAWDGITVAKKLIPFFNSNLQGIYKVYRALARGDSLGMSRAQARKILIGNGIKMALAASVYNAYMMQDDDYKKVRKDIADQNMLVPIGGGQFFKIPIPFELGAMFWTVPANVVRTMSGDETSREMWQALGQAALRQSPDFIPQFAKPALEDATNYSFFTGRPLESAAMQNLAPEQRITSNTSQLAQDVGSATGLSPIKIDNLLTGYTGSIGTFVIGMVDKLLAPDNAPSTPFNREPIVRALVTNPNTARDTDRFYEIKNMADQVYNTATSLKNSGDVQKARDYLQNSGVNGTSNIELYRLHQALGTINTQLQNLHKMQRAVRASNASPDMKRAQLDRISQEINTLTAKALPYMQHRIGE